MINTGLKFKAEEVEAQETGKQADWRTRGRSASSLVGLLTEAFTGVGIAAFAGGSGRHQVMSRDAEV